MVGDDGAHAERHPCTWTVRGIESIMPAHLSPELKLFMQTAADGDRCQLIASLRRQADAGELIRLASSTGCRVRQHSGELVTLECDRTALEHLIRWPGLHSLEMSGPLFPEE